ncbi:MAG: Dps family protein [Sphingomonadales bacterium]
MSARTAKRKTKATDPQAALIEGLSKALADTYILRLRTQCVHWNIEGALFFSVHSLTETLYNELALAADELAERIRALGAKALGSYGAFAKLTAVDTGEVTGTDKAMVKALIKDNEAIVETLKLAIAAAEAVEDKPSEDMLIARRQSHEKTIWMLKAIVA